MKEQDIHIGRFYDVKVGKSTTPVRIMRMAKDGKGGWEGITVAGDKDILIRSADRIVGLHKPKADKHPKPATTPATDQPAPPEAKRLSALDAAAKVLAEAKEPMNCKQLMDTMTAKGYWKPSQGGKTPANTLHAAIGTEIKKKGGTSRFEKVGRGQFGLRSQ